jgi:curved DNA-binding protein CbpA
MKAKPICPYAVLNIPVGSNDEDIKDAYKRLSRLLHPDKRPSGSERQAAQEIFIELRDAYELLSKPCLRQAYDHFGHIGVSIVRHNPHEANSLFNTLSKLHEDGKPTDALKLLENVLEESKLSTQKQLDFNAGVNVDLHLCSNDEGLLGMERLEVKSTNISISTSIPIIPDSQHNDNAEQKQQQGQKLNLSFGGQSDLDNALGSTKSVLAATYQPRKETDVTSQLVIDRKRMETNLSSNHVLANGTRLSAKMTRRYEWESSKAGNLSFGFSSNRVLTMYQGRTVHATFSFGVGSNLKMQYGILSLVTWGFGPTSPEDDANEEDMDENNVDDDENSRQNSRDTNERKLLPPPQLSAKFVLGSQFPLEFGIAQNDLFHSPYRSGDATISWGFTGYRIKGMINREIPSYNTSELYNSQLSSVGIGIEHTPLSGLKWLLRYERPEGVTIHIPIFVSRFLAPNYFNDVIWWSALSFLLDETIGELCQQTPQTSIDSTTTSKRETITDKMTANTNEQQWLTSSNATSNAEKQLNIMRPVAARKRKREAACNGLVIIKATYYRQILSPETSYDVTEQLQFFAQNSCLVLPASSKSFLLGFSQLERVAPQPEPNHSYASMGKIIFASLFAKPSNKICEDSSVRLTVRYKFKGNVFETTIGDDDSLQLPNEEDLNLGESYLVT